MARSRSPGISSASRDVVAVQHAFISCAFAPSCHCRACRSSYLRSEKIELLADLQVQAEHGSPHGSWTFVGADDLILCWHYCGRNRKVLRHRYGRIENTNAWQLVEVGDLTDAVQIPLTFLFPLTQGTPHAPSSFNFIHHAQVAAKYGGKFKTMAFQEGGLVKFEGTEPHGSWHHGDNGALVAKWQCYGEVDYIKTHCYHKLPQTDVWRLASRGANSVHDDTLLIPSTPVV